MNRRLSSRTNNKLFKRNAVKTKKINKSRAHSTPGGGRL